MPDKAIRVRFAPSPTGPLHMGGVRTALFNYFFAKKANGAFILRVEDTDQTRFVPGAEEYIIESLQWCGIKIDEGVNEGGEYGPYRQSERKDIYAKYAEELLEKGFAYYAFDTPEELDAKRKECEAKKETFIYDSKTRKSLNNSLNMSSDECKKIIDSGTAYVIRFKMPENTEIEMNDLIRGNIRVNSSTLDDKVLFKSDGMPTYHLANIVDDYLMKISHVIRGEEWLPSLPLHVMLYKAFGWEKDMPEFAHLPLLLKPSGSGKLSKRDGDKLGFPVFPLNWVNPKTGETASGYRESGYFNDAFVNLLALLGWNPGTEQELFSLDELIENFSLDRVGKSGSRFDPEKAKWFNHHYLQQRSDQEIAEAFAQILQEKGIDKDFAFVEKVTSLVKERVSFVQELWDQSGFFFEAPSEYDAKTVKKRWKENSPEIMKDIIKILSDTDHFEAETLEENVKQYINENELGMGAVMNAFRLCLVGEPKGPGVFDIVETLGKEESIQRIEKAISTITK